MTTATNTEGLRIVSLEAQNVKRLKAVSITPSGDVVIIGGRNEQGKSSVLDSIMMALEGGNSICKEPIHRGASRGVTTLDLGEFIVTRTYTAAGGNLVVKTKDGAKFSSPQAILDKLTGSLSFDPLAFTKMKAKEQLETLRELVGVNTDLIDTQRKARFDARTETNREIKAAETQVTNLAKAVEGKEEPAETPDGEKLSAELTAVRAHNKGNADTRKHLERALELRDAALQAEKDYFAEHKRLSDLLAAHEATLPAIQDRCEKTVSSYDRGVTFCAALVDKDEEAILQTILNANAIASLKTQFENLRSWQTELARLQAIATEQTAQIARFDDRKRDRIQSAKYPIAGMTLGDDGILMDGIPFEQASAAQKLKISVAMGVAMNPRLRVILIRDGSLLDEDSMQTIAEMAAEHNMQFWVERVGKADECAIVIEDGQVEGSAE